MAGSRIGFGYDAVGQLTSTFFGDGSPGISRDYWPDGKLKTVASNGSVWSYSYNALGSLQQESLDVGGISYTFTRGFNAAGDVSTLSSQTTPQWLGLSVNCLLRPTARPLRER